MQKLALEMGALGTERDMLWLWLIKSVEQENLNYACVAFLPGNGRFAETDLAFLQISSEERFISE